MFKAIRYIVLIYLLLQALANKGFTQNKSGTFEATPDGASETRKTWAVVIGISKYKNIQWLNYADKDASAFYEYLVNKDGGPQLPPSQVKLLLNENALSAEIYGALDWLRESVGKNDRVLFYFSGHGDAEKETIAKNGYLLAYDSPVAAYATSGTVNTVYLQKYFETYISVNKAKEVIMIADACRSGKLAGGNEGTRLTLHALGQNDNNKIIKILSAQENEQSYESSRWGGGGGVFSYYLLKGIKGMANRNSDSLITTAELARYLHTSVADATGNIQNPSISGNPEAQLFSFNSKLIASARQSDNTKTQATINIGEGNPYKLTPAIRVLYKKYLDYVKQGRLMFGKNEDDTVNCARYYYTLLAGKPGAAEVFASLKSSFVSVLQHKTQDILDKYVQVEPQLYNRNEAFKEISYSQKLIGSDYILHNYLMARIYFLQIFCYPGKGNGDRGAIDLLQKTLQYEEDAPYALNEIGDLYRHVGLIDSAIFYLKKAIEASPRWSFPYNNLGLIFNQLNDYKNAMLYYKKAIELNSRFPTALYNLGLVYQNLGDDDNALINYNKSLQDDTTIHFVYNNIGAIYFKKKEYEKAISNYKKAVKLDTLYADGYFNLGEVYGKIRNYDQSLIYYKKSFKIDSTHADVSNNIGAIYAALKNNGQAINYYNRAIKLDTNYAEAYYNLAGAYVARNNYADAIFSCKRALKIDTTNASYWGLLGYCLINNHQLDEGVSKLERAISLHPEDADSYYRLACAWAIAKKINNSEGCLKKALDIGFNNYDQIMQDDDLAILKKDAAFLNLIRQYFPDKVHR